MYALTKYSYPGNIRELENIIEHATVLAEGGVIRLEDLPEEVQACAREQTMAIPHIKGEHNDASQVVDVEPVELPGISFESSAKTEKKPAAESEADGELLSLEEMERRHILRALSVCGGNRTEVCKRLGISRATLWRKLKELKIMMDGDDA